MNKAIQQIRQNVRKARVVRTQGVNNAQNLYNRAVGDANYTGAEVGDYVTGMNSRIGAGYDQTGAAMAAARSALQQQMQSTTQQNATDAGSELSRLGIQASGLGNLSADASAAQLASQNAGTAEQNGNMFAKQNAGAVGDLLLGMNQGQRQSVLGKLLNSRNDDITSIREAYRQSRMNSLDTINQIRAAGSGGSGYHRSSYTPYHRYSSGGSSGTSTNKYAQTAAGQKAILTALGGKRSPKPVNPMLGHAPNHMESSLMGMFTAHGQ